MAIKEFMPAKYKHMLGGPSVKVDLHTGAIAEGVLTFVISFIVLFVLMRGPKSKFLKLWLLAATTVTLVVNGSKYTGPAMNPANVNSTASVLCSSLPFSLLFLVMVDLKQNQLLVFRSSGVPIN